MRFSFTKLGILGIALVFPGGLSAGSMFWTSPDPGLPPMIPGEPRATVYLTGPGTHAIFGTQDGTVDLLNIRHTNFSNVMRATSGSNEMETFDSSLFGMVSVDGSPDIAFELNGPVTVTDFGKAGKVTGTFNTQMDSMDMTGTVDGHSVVIMLDPARPTTGQTTITQVSPSLYHINSFFDVFTELSIDHGAFFPQIGGPSVVTLTCTPEPRSVGLLALGLLGFVGLWVRGLPPRAS